MKYFGVNKRVAFDYELIVRGKKKYLKEVFEDIL